MIINIRAAKVRVIGEKKKRKPKKWVGEAKFNEFRRRRGIWGMGARAEGADRRCRPKLARGRG
jgi:hypothetical protein